MMEFITTWGTAIGIFAVVGTLMEAVNKTAGRKGGAGAKGIAGVWYLWKRVLVMPLGGALGACAGAFGMSTPLGEGLGYGILAGVLAAAVAGQCYESIVGSFKAFVKHKLAKNGKPKPGEEDTKP